MSRDNSFQGKIERLSDHVEGSIAPSIVLSVMKVLSDCLEEPQSCIDRVVLGNLTVVGETIRQHASVDEADELEQYLQSQLGSICCKKQAGKSDHGVATPIAKPVVSSDDRVTGRSRDDELIRRGLEDWNQIRPSILGPLVVVREPTAFRLIAPVGWHVRGGVRFG